MNRILRNVAFLSINNDRLTFRISGNSTDPTPLFREKKWGGGLRQL